MPAGGVCASPRVCDLHINVKVCRQMSRFLRFNQLKVAGCVLGRGDKGVCAGRGAENGVTLAGGLLWLPNAASVAAAVALL